MVFEHLALPWNWSYTHSQSTPPTHQRKKSKKSHIRSRAEQPTQNGNAKHPSHASTKNDKPPVYYPGLVNISGTYCFMNSTIQAMASLSYLQPQIDRIHAKAEALDVPSPVVDAIRDLLHALNIPHPRSTSIEPSEIIQALSNYSPGKNNSLFSSREHQDAQELFQFLSECIKSETAAIDKEGHRDRGLSGLAELKETNYDIGKSVFDGLTANRRSCVECGYTEAVMHFAFDNWQLAVPRLQSSCRLEDCLADYTRLELLRDCICRKCSMLATHKRLLQEMEKHAVATKPGANPSSSKKKRARDARKMEAAVKAALDDGRIEDDIKGLRMERVFSKASTKQAMIARPPPVLALHINRSVHFGQYASKNNIRVVFPEVLDLTPFTTSGKLSTVASAPISSPPPYLPRSTTPTPATYSTPRILYRLSAVVCHYGQHSFGHYVCFRRTPRPFSAGPKRFAPPTLTDPLAYTQDSTATDPNAPPLTWEDEVPPAPGHGWLRVSDESIRECGIETVLTEGSGAFMLYYERVAQPRLGMHYTLHGSPRSSEETLKAETLTLRANGSIASLSTTGDPGGVGVGSVGTDVGVLRETKKVAAERVPGARVVRSVAAGRGRGRSMSAAPSSEREKERERERESSAGPSFTLARTPKPRGSTLPPPLPNGTAINGGASTSAAAAADGDSDAPATVDSSAQKSPVVDGVHVNGVVDSPPSSPSPCQPPLEETSPTSPAITSVRLPGSPSEPTTSSSSSPSSSPPTALHHPKERPPPRIQSPQPIHPSTRPAMVGLKA